MNNNELFSYFKYMNQRYNVSISIVVSSSLNEINFSIRQTDKFVKLEYENTFITIFFLPFLKYNEAYSFLKKIEFNNNIDCAHIFHISEFDSFNNLESKIKEKTIYNECL